MVKWWSQYSISNYEILLKSLDGACNNVSLRKSEMNFDLKLSFNLNIFLWESDFWIDIPAVKWTTPSTTAPYRVNDIFAATKPTLNHGDRLTTPHKVPEPPSVQDMQLLPDSSNQEMRTLRSTRRPLYNLNNHDTPLETNRSVCLSSSLTSLIAVLFLIIFTLMC